MKPNVRKRVKTLVPVLALMASLSSMRLQGEEHVNGTTQVGPQIDLLSSESFEERESAQKAILKMGCIALPALSKALASAEDPELVSRLRTIIKHISRPDWKTDLNTAIALAKESNRPLMIFSTIGSIDGFS